MALQWTSALATGVRGIDEQHEELFRRFESLEDAILRRDRSEASRLLAFLHDYVREHFSAEEALMRLVGYPGAAGHAAEHDAFAREIAKLDFQQSMQGNSAELILRLDREVGGWLRDHIYGSDVALARFVQARQWSGRFPPTVESDGPAHLRAT